MCIAQAQTNCSKYPLKQINNIIPNPSFEVTDSTLCPTGYVYTTLKGLPNWFEPTTRFTVALLNHCSNFIIPDSIVAFFFQKYISFSLLSYTVYPPLPIYPIVPEPIPDGSSVVAINDIAAANGRSIDTFGTKSYIATCLQQPLLKDSLYTISFYVGFGKRKYYSPFYVGNFFYGFVVNGRDSITSTQPYYYSNETPPYSPSPEKFTLFGWTDCNNLPKPTNIRTCLSTIGWENLGSTVVSGDTGTWVKTSIQFRPQQNINVIALGPSCDTMYLQSTDIIGNYSYFLDNLQLYQSTIALPFININAGSLCNKSVILSLQASYIHSTNTSFQWYKNGAILNGENNSSLTVTNILYGEGYYQCKAQSDSLCLLSDSFKVAWPVVPNSNILGQDTVACIGDTVLLNAFTDAVSTYQWQDGSSNSFFKAIQSGLYSVNISNSCATVQSTKKIDFEKCNPEIFVPTAFTPNGDGLNDVFRVRYFQAPISFSIKVFNRFGQIIFATTNPSQSWDGTLHNFPQPSGTYVWVMDYTDHDNVKHTNKGTLVLIR